MRSLVSLLGIVAVFGAVVVYGGNYVGAWDEIEPAQPAAPGPRAAGETTAADEEPAPAQTTTQAAVPAKTLTPAERRWRREASAVCRRAIEEAASLPQPSTQAEAKAVLAQAVDLNAFYNDEFASLGAPPGGEAGFAELLALFEKEERILSRMLDALRRGNLGFYAKLSDRLVPVALDEDDLLYELGADGCTVPLPQISY